MNNPSGPFMDNTSFENFSDNTTRRLKHPVITFFHLIFRSLALIVYLLCGWYSDSFIGSFVSIILLLSLDFWTVKNITGRFMVGLRWWNYIDNDGESKWVFESRSSDQDPASPQKLSSTEIYIFWAGLVAAPALWILFFFTALFSFKLKWLVLVIIGLSLSGSNLLGYLRCRMGQTDNTATMLSGMANTYLQKAMVQSMVSKASGIFKSTPQPASASGGLTV